MKFLVTLNMPSASGMLVHQIIIDHESKTCRQFYDSLNNEEFMLCKQWYRRKHAPGDIEWEDRGELIVNTSHIGKVQEYIDYDSEESNEPRRNSGPRQNNNENSRGPVRPRNNML